MGDPPTNQPSDPPHGDVFDRLVAAMNDAGVSFVHLQHEPVYTSRQAADVRGTPLHSGAKALIVKAGKAFQMAVLPADMALDSNTLRKFLGVKRLRFATKEEVLAMTGLTPGSIPPFGSLFDLPVTCDEGLAENDSINFNAGRHTDSLQLTYEAYFDYESPVMARIAKPPEPKPPDVDA